MEPEFEYRVIVEAEVSPSEDPEKVALAVANVAGAEPRQVLVSRNQVRIASNDPGSLKRLREQLKARRVRTAAKAAMYREKRGSSTTLLLNRQAAVSGVLVVCGGPEESPLGPIYLRIQSRRLEEVIEWLTSYESG